MGQNLFSLRRRDGPSTERMGREIDKEHARIFTLVGEFIASIKSGADPAIILRLIEKIIQQTSAHCRVEENMLRLMDHPSLASQRDTHKRIMDELTAFRDRILNGKAAPISEHWHLLDSLIVHHIRDEPGYCGWSTLPTGPRGILDEHFN